MAVEIEAKLRRLCDAFGAQTYQVPDLRDRPEINKELVATRAEIRDKDALLDRLVRVNDDECSLKMGVVSSLDSACRPSPDCNGIQCCITMRQGACARGTSVVVRHDPCEWKLVLSVDGQETVLDAGVSKMRILQQISGVEYPAYPKD